MQATVFAVLLSLVGSAAPAPSEESARALKIAVMPVKLSKSAGKDLERGFLDEMLLAAVQGAGDFSIIGKSDIDAVLGLEKQRDLLGCSDTACVAELGGALGVDRLIDAQVAKTGSTWSVTMKLINLQASEPRVDARLAEPAVSDTPEGLLAALPRLARTLLADAGLPTKSLAARSPAPATSSKSPLQSGAAMPAAAVATSTSSAATAVSPATANAPAAESAAWAEAERQLERLRPTLAEFAPTEVGLAKFKDSLAAATKACDELAATYRKLLVTETPERRVRALARLAEIYERLAVAIEQAPVPDTIPGYRLQPEDKASLRTQLHEQAAPVRAVTQQGYRECAMLAESLGLAQSPDALRCRAASGVAGGGAQGQQSSK